MPKKVFRNNSPKVVSDVAYDFEDGTIMHLLEDF